MQRCVSVNAGLFPRMYLSYLRKAFPLTTSTSTPHTLSPPPASTSVVHSALLCRDASLLPGQLQPPPQSPLVEDVRLRIQRELAEGPTRRPYCGPTVGGEEVCLLTGVEVLLGGEGACSGRSEQR